MSVSSTSRRAITVVLTAALACMPLSYPSLAYAETSEELEIRLQQAQATLAELGQQAMAAGESLYETQYSLEETKQKIEATNTEVEQKTQELQDKKEALAKRIRASYKVGPLAPLLALLSEDSFESLDACAYYASKLADQDAKTIQEVTDAKAALQDQAVQLGQLQVEQEELLQRQQVQYEALQVAESAQSAYVASLDQALRDRIEQEKERDKLEQQAAAGDEEAKLQLQLIEKQEQEALEAPELNVPAAAGINIADITGDARSTMSGETRMAILSAAFSQIGVPYLWGGEQPGVGLDCSGFTQYCYRQAGIELPHSARAQAAMARASSIENMQPGDLVFWLGTSGAASGDHVAIYLGNGNIIHESPGGVRIVPLFSGYSKFGVII